MLTPSATGQSASVTLPMPPQRGQLGILIMHSGMLMSVIAPVVSKCKDV